MCTSGGTCIEDLSWGQGDVPSAKLIKRRTLILIIGGLTLT